MPLFTSSISRPKSEFNASGVNVPSNLVPSMDPLSRPKSPAEDAEFLASQQKLHQNNDAAIVEELNKLTLRERETILHDLHGVSDAVPENPELLKRSLHQMDLYLSSSSHLSRGYCVAQDQDPAYVQDFKLRRMFLRSEHFHVKAAAERLQRFLNLKLDLFGPEKLCRPITLEDLTKDDRECLGNGHVQLLNSRDRAGRAIFVLASHHIRYKAIENELRQMFYVHMSALEEEETQLNGVVMIAYGLPQQAPWNVWRVSQMTAALPYHVRGWHVANAALGPWMGWLSAILETRARMRTRYHNGTHVEILYSLMTFGIPTSDFPIDRTDDGVEKIFRDNHLKWIQARRHLEQRRKLQAGDTVASSTIDAVLSSAKANPTRPNMFGKDDENENDDDGDDDNQNDTGKLPDSKSSEDGGYLVLPTSKDVLFGRGRPYQEHAGNVRFSLILESLRPRYEALGRNEKTTLARDVVNKMKSKGTRFLRHVDGYWEQVEDRVAREKVSQGFRSIRSGKHSGGQAPSVKTSTEEDPPLYLMGADLLQLFDLDTSLAGGNQRKVQLGNNDEGDHDGTNKKRPRQA